MHQNEIDIRYFFFFFQPTKQRELSVLTRLLVIMHLVRCVALLTISPSMYQYLYHSSHLAPVTHQLHFNATNYEITNLLHHRTQMHLLV